MTELPKRYEITKGSRRGLSDRSGVNQHRDNGSARRWRRKRHADVPGVSFVDERRYTAWLTRW